MSKSTTYTKDGKVIETINNFSDGISSNIRGGRNCAISKNLRHYTDRLELRRGLVRDTNTTENLKSLCQANNDIYAINATWDEIWTKTSFTTATAFSMVSAVNASENTWLFEYANFLFYMDGTSLNYFGDITGTPAETTGFKTFSLGLGAFPTIRPFVHPTDGYAYFFDRNNMYQLKGTPATGSNWTQASASIPARYSIVSACSFGEYIAIFAWDREEETTWMYLWDRSLTLETFVDVKEWADGETVYSATLGGNLFGVTSKNLAGGIGYQNIHYYTGNAVQFLENSSLTSDDIMFTGSFQYKYSLAQNNSLLFTGLEFQDDSANGRNNFLYELTADGKLTTAVFEDITNDDIESFIRRNDYIFVTTESGFVYRPITDTNTIVNNYSNAGVYITPAMNAGDPFTTKRPESIRVAHSPILTGGSVKVDYYNTETAAWVTVGTNSTAGTTRTEFVSISGVNFKKSQEHFFRVTINKTRFVFTIELRSVIETDAKS